MSDADLARDFHRRSGEHEAVSDPCFCVLGRLEVWRGGQRLDMPAGRRCRVLAALLVHAGAPLPVDALVEAAWGADVPADPRAALYTVVSRLRSLLGEHALITRPDGYRIDASADSVDAIRFERLCRTAATVGPEQAAVLLDEGLGLWRGPAYAEFVEHDFAAVEAQRLELLRADAQEERARLALELGDPQGAARVLASLLDGHPFREHAVELLMTALHRGGRTGDALACYQNHRRRMADELGLDPALALQNLEARILGQSRPTPPPPPRETCRRTRLAGHLHGLRPRTRTRIAGRGCHREQGGDRHRNRRGRQDPPRRRSTPRPKHPNPAAGRRRGTSRRTARTRRRGGRRRALARRACARAGSAGRPADPPLPGCTGGAHQQARLGLPSEHVLPVPPLAGPAVDDPDRAARSAAVRLLVDRVQRAQPAFTLTPQNLPAIADICRRVDGLPLALELAASRVAVLGVHAVRDTLERDPGILDHVATGEHPLRALTAWSCNLLPADQRDLFATLSVFPGEFDLQAARGVACGLRAPASGAAVAGMLADLVDASLVATRDATPGPRYRMLTVVRTHALRMLDESGRRRQAVHAHARWIATLTGQAATDWTGPAAAAAVQRLQQSQADIAAALRWALAVGQLDLAASITAAIGQCPHWIPRPELAELTIEVGERCLHHHGPQATLGIAAAAVALMTRGDLHRSMQLGSAAGAAASNPTERYLAHLALGVAALYGGDHNTSHRHWQTIVDLHELPLALRTEAHSSLSLLARYAGDLDLAREEGKLALLLAETTGSAPVHAFASYAAGEAAVAQPDQGTDLLTAAAEEATAIGCAQVSQLARVALLAALVRTHHHDKAARLAATLLHDIRRAGAWPQLWTTVRIVAELQATIGHSHEATLLLAAADLHPSAPPATRDDIPRYASLRETLRTRLGTRAADRIRAAASSASREQIADRAIAILARH